MLKELPDLYKSAAASVKNLKPATELYEAFVEFTGKKVENYFAMISYVMENGNTTTYEWKYGEKPKEIIEPDLNIKFDDEVNENDTVSTSLVYQIVKLEIKFKLLIEFASRELSLYFLL